MEDFRTSRQILSSIETGINKLINKLSVEEEKNEYEDKIDKVYNLLQNYKAGTQTNNEIDISNEYLEKFNRERISWFTLSAIILLIITIIFYSYNSILFLISAGFFMANIGILMQIFYDWKLTPGDSYAKISKDPIAIAITLFVIAFYTFMGISVAEKYIPDSFRGEASQRIEERLNNIEEMLNKEASEASRNDDEEGGNSNRIPNR